MAEAHPSLHHWCVDAGRDVTHGRWARRWRAIFRDRQSAFELLLGRDNARPVIVRAESLWTIAVGGSAILALALPHATVEGLHSGAMLAIIVPGVLAAIVVALLADRVSGDLEIALAVASVALLLVAVALAGPDVGMSVVPVGCSVALSFLFFRRRIAMAVSTEVAVGYGIVLASQDGYPAPMFRWLVFVASTTATGMVMAWAVGLIEQLAVQERDAAAELDAAHRDMAVLNQQLAERVDQQSGEIGSLNRLRRFLSPQVADALLHDGIEALAPHRGRIAVMFCDLRGFTAFSSSAEPEEVMEVLDRYYVTVGRALQACGATVGTFSGDGIMAYFGDPVPHEDAAGAAVHMAVAVREPMRQVVERWRQRGFDLGCGIGIAFGYATIGPVGFDERTDYTALGPTVNLASRLCGMAEDGEILIDGRANEAVLGRVEVEEREVELRGFDRPAVAHRVLAWIGAAPSSEPPRAPD